MGTELQVGRTDKFWPLRVLMTHRNVSVYNARELLNTVKMANFPLQAFYLTREKGRKKNW